MGREGEGLKSGKTVRASTLPEHPNRKPQATVD